jgi:hypothetical protein
MKRDSIRDFIAAWQQYDLERNFSGISWNIRFREAGYYRSELRNFGSWSYVQVHQWCREKFGDRYAQAGNIFWFDNEQDCIMFTLRWS